MEAPINMTFEELEGLLRPLLQQHLQVSTGAPVNALTAASHADLMNSSNVLTILMWALAGTL
jgi:hypothetical protein